MSLRIQNNVEAFNAHRNLVGSSHNLAKSMERLASGFRINRAADDAAGLAIRERLRAQTRGLGQAERNQRASEIERIGPSSEFNGIKLLNAAATVTFQVGANDGEQFVVSTISLGSAVGATALALTAAGTTDITEIDAAINAVSTQRAEFGAVQNRLEHTLNNLTVYQENLVASESRIRDVDMASEMVQFTKLQILQQAGTAMLAQAQQSTQSVLSLLR